MLVRLASRVRQTLRLESAQCFCWIDSTITLAWIKQEPTTWKTYVANRVSKIQMTLPGAIWLHIPGVENPADLPSKGLLASDLAKSFLWIHGPTFLICSSAPWNRSSNCNLDDLPEPLERRAVSCLAARANPSNLDIIARFSLSRLVNAIARCLQFPQRTRARIEARGSVSKMTQDSLQTAALTPNNLLHALLALVHWVLHIYFAEEIGCLEKGDPLPRKSVLLRLYPILDEQNHLRVGGRLRHSLLHPDERHSLILAQESHLVKLLVLDAHHKTLHGGTQLTLNYLRQRFWIIRGRQLVKSTILTCIRCWRQKAQPATQLMGDLPSKRVQPSRPFLHSGVDYAGSIYLRFSKGRGAKSYKGYICVFVCFSTRAVHLETVSSYSTADFLSAYKRFTARRGICASLTSDCGLNFVGADKELRVLFKQAGVQHTEIKRLLAADGTDCEWRFNPPGAPHFSGLWEAAVKSVKFHLKRVIGEALLTFEEMTALLAQIEACLNSHPLQPLTNDPKNLNALTPGHFLIGEPTLTISGPSLLDDSVSRLDKWQLLRQMQEQFWRRWSQEYLQHLQIRPKWQTKETQAKVGDLCLLRSDQYPPCKWQLARIIVVHPGEDEVVRIVDVKNATSSYTRPTTKISLLPQENHFSSVPAKGGRDVPKPA